jgi:hypothetical protein
MSEYGYEAIVGTYPLLRASLPYVDDTLRARLIPFFGLLASLEGCFTRASDTSVTRSKLGWWYEELQNALVAQPNHPLTSSLLDSGALARWSPAMLDRLFQLSLHRVDHPGLNDEKELHALCQSIGSIHLELEASLSDETTGATAGVADGTDIMGFTQILRECYLAKLPNFYWIPLSLTAATGLARSQVGGLQEGKVACRVMAGLLEAPTRWSQDGHQAAENTHPKNPALVARCSHWRIHAALQRRQLQRLHTNLADQALPGMISGELQALRFGDSWTAWRKARQISRERKSFGRRQEDD